MRKLELIRMGKEHCYPRCLKRGSLECCSCPLSLERCCSFVIGCSLLLLLCSGGVGDGQVRRCRTDCGSDWRGGGVDGGGGTPWGMVARVRGR